MATKLKLTKDAKIKRLRDELGEMLQWALIEKAPLRDREIESIRTVLEETK